MAFAELDAGRLIKIESLFDVRCSHQAPFAPTTLVPWICNSKGHSWTASAIEVQIDGGCFQCVPGDIRVAGNGSFVQSMSKTLSDVVIDFENQQFRPESMYLPDAALHIALASFFFSAVRTEFVLKAQSECHPALGLVNSATGKEFSTVELVERMFTVGSANIGKFTIPGIATGEALEKYKVLKERVVLYVIARNKIAHGYSKYPVSGKGNYNAQIADLIKSFGNGGLNEVYSTAPKFLDLSERFLDDSPAGISLGNKILWDLFVRS